MVIRKSPVPGSAASPAGFLLPKFKRDLAVIKAGFADPFWRDVGPSMIAVMDMLDGFNDRLTEIERQSKDREQGAQTALGRDE